MCVRPFALPMTLQRQGSREQEAGGQRMAHVNQRRHSLIPPAFDSPTPRPLILQATALGGVLILAAWLRWQYILHVQPYPDEFVTLLAVKMILQKGLPLLPSGLFYDHGLLFSYAGGLASALFGFSREVVRATSLVFHQAASRPDQAAGCALDGRESAYTRCRA